MIFMKKANAEQVNKKKRYVQRILLCICIISLPVLLWVWYHAVTPQDRYFIRLEEADLKHIFIYNGRTGRSEIELEGDDRQAVAEQLLQVTLKGGWRTEGMDSRGQMYHIVLTDGREFDFGVTSFMEQGTDGMFQSFPHYVIDGIRMYNVHQKEEGLSEQIKKRYAELMSRLYPA